MSKKIELTYVQAQWITDQIVETMLNNRIIDIDDEVYDEFKEENYDGLNQEELDMFKDLLEKLNA